MTGPHMREGGDLRSGISRAGSNRKWTGMIRYDSEGFSLCMVSQYRTIGIITLQAEIIIRGVEQSLVTAWSGHIMSQGYICHNC